MFKMNLTFDMFGGEVVVMEKLAECGLLSKKCSYCHCLGSWVFEADRLFPRVRCPVCRKKSYSADDSPLSKKGIGDIPLFLFVSFCFSLRIPQKAVVSLTGCDPRTVKKYQDALRD